MFDFPEMQLLSICIQMGLYGKRGQPALVQGAPGTGKTQVISQVAEALEIIMNHGVKKDSPEYRKMPCEIIAVPQRMPEEFGGIPVPNKEEGTVDCLPMRVGKDLITAGRGIMVFDEYSSAPQATGSACMTIIQDGRLANVTLPHAVARVLLMNQASCAANGRLLTAPESNRMCWINWNPPLEAWQDYMRGGKGIVANCLLLPNDWEEQYGKSSKNLIVAFSRVYRDLFEGDKHVPKPQNASQAWPSLRSWENAARLLAAVQACGHNYTSDMASLAVKGCVGDGAEEAFMVWARELCLPNPEDGLKDPKAALPVYAGLREDQLGIALESLATAACIKTPPMEKKEKRTAKDVREERWLNAWEIIGVSLKSSSDQALWAAQTLAKELGDMKHLKEAVDLRANIGALLKSIGAY